jgi:hypothetical protein
MVLFNFTIERIPPRVPSEGVIYLKNRPPNKNIAEHHTVLGGR